MQISFERSAEEHKKNLESIINGGVATKVRILTNFDCCPTCQSLEGAYAFDEVPLLPIEECAHPLGCRCFYAPVLDRRGP